MNGMMTKWMTTLLALTFILGMQAQNVEYTKADSALVVKLLTDAQTQRGKENRVFYFGKKFLELGDTEHLIVNLHGLDCTTFVETVVALSMCDMQNQRTFDDFCKNLTKIRFRDGKMTDYTSRLHYFTWWAEDNERKGIVKDISIDDAPFFGTQTVHINYMSQHPTLYKQLKNHPEFVPVIKGYEQATEGKQFRYILKQDLSWQAGTPLSMVKDGDIVAMLTDWKNGKLHLLHASSLYKKVLMSQETFYEYEKKQAKHTGIRVFRLVEP